MLPRKPLTKPEEMIQIQVPKSRIRRPFPLMWGLVSLALFGVFAAVTLLEFSRINSEKIYQARLDAYYSDLRVYDTAVDAHNTCIDSIAVRETYRNLFAGVSSLFQKSADLPVQLFPDSKEALAYQSSMSVSIIELISTPVAEGLPSKEPGDCPDMPANVPVKPEK